MRVWSPLMERVSTPTNRGFPKKKDLKKTPWKPKNEGRRQELKSGDQSLVKPSRWSQGRPKATGLERLPHRPLMEGCRP